jgi:hypothetical protein
MTHIQEIFPKMSDNDVVLYVVEIYSHEYKFRSETTFFTSIERAYQHLFYWLFYDSDWCEKCVGDEELAKRIYFKYRKNVLHHIDDINNFNHWVSTLLDRYTCPN